MGRALVSSENVSLPSSNERPIPGVLPILVLFFLNSRIIQTMRRYRKRHNELCSAERSQLFEMHHVVEMCGCKFSVKLHKLPNKCNNAALLERDNEVCSAERVVTSELFEMSQIFKSLGANFQTKGQITKV